MTAPGGAGTPWSAHFTRARLTGFYYGVGAPSLEALALRFAALPRSDAPGLSPARILLMYSLEGGLSVHKKNSARWKGRPFRGTWPYRAAAIRYSPNRVEGEFSELRRYGVLGSSH